MTAGWTARALDEPRREPLDCFVGALLPITVLVRPNLHPHLVNGRFGDPALYVEMLHRRDALLFDMGDLSGLSARDLLRVDHVFVTHTHMDHFIGFDTLLRVCVGREKLVRMVGPSGFRERVEHKLLAYQWDLYERYDTDLVFEVLEVGSESIGRTARFRFKTGFAREDGPETPIQDGVVAKGSGFVVRAALLEHHGPCLGYSAAEPVHVNVWKSRLEERGLAAGQWLQALKQMILDGAPDEAPIELPDGGSTELGGLRDLISVTRGQKIAYVTDVADSPANRAAITALAADSDTFFLEACFAAADEDHARHRAHLTTRACGEIGRAAGVRRLEPFHFSPRYAGEEERMLNEVAEAFGGPLGP
ncbi:MAG TPA: MBL fold metallo-hydrolase [Allosphingosinicella sp.]